MRLYVIFRYVGLIMLVNALFMLLSSGVAMLNGYDSGFYPLLMSFILTCALGVFPLIFVRGKESVTTKEGYMVVVLAWLLACFVGTMPYLIWGGEFSLVNAWFESVSGFSTTGSTILNNIEALPKSLLFWRSCTHWLGGIGVVMFVLVVLPSLGQTKMRLSSVELSSFAKDNYRYRTQKILRILLFVYVGLTACEIVLLKLAGMSIFDAVTHSFSTIASGGFSTRNASIAAFDSVWIEIIIMFFMAVAGIHFGLIFATITGKSNNIFKSEVTRYYLFGILGAGSILVALNLWFSGIYDTLAESLRHGAFQVISITTTTGFATADSTLWTSFTTIILILLGIQCACAGSTSGGIKADRMLLMFKSIRAQMIRRQHPNAVIRIRLNNVVQEPEVINAAILFIVVYLLLLAGGTLVCTLFNIDLVTSFTMIASSMGNVGPGFGEVGSLDNYSAMPAVIKYICTFFMLLGRLEIFGLLQLFVISSWK